MKLRQAFAIGAFLFVPLAHAAEPATPPPPPGEMMMGMSPETDPDLKLTPEQRTQVKAVWEEARAKHDAIRQAAHDKLAKILTPEQMKRWEERRAERMERRADRMERRSDHMEKRSEHMEKRSEHMQDRAQKMRDRAADK